MFYFFLARWVGVSYCHVRNIVFLLSATDQWNIDIVKKNDLFLLARWVGVWVSYFHVSNIVFYFLSATDSEM